MGAIDTGAVGATALRVAVRRAAHQWIDRPLVFEDPLAVRIIGAREAERLRSHIGGAEREWNNSLRAWIAARSRYAEDQLSRAVAHGVTQYVVLGAGLDTFAYRNRYPSLRVWEVDRPAAQGAKRRMLRDAGIDVPASVSYVAADFEQIDLAELLKAAGVEPGAFVSWLGVTPFLSLEAFERALASLAHVAAQLVFDYAVTREALDEQDRFAFDLLSRRVGAVGEPYRLCFPAQAAFTGFMTIEDVGKTEINDRYFAGRADGLQVRFTPSRLVSCVPARRFDSHAW
ncbi:MAG: class I SAM-dependent methyltransferase [Acidobacteria bacterium]|nr:class I SAM-dependent methyltransferase [Acidobacteriota bacterium]